MRLCLLLPGLAFAVPVLASDELEELQRLRGYVTTINERVVELQGLLIEAEQRAFDRSREIDRLESEFADKVAVSAAADDRRAAFFARLRELTPESALFRVEDYRVRIEVPSVFVFGNSELGYEGRRRLEPLARALNQALPVLPQQADWRLRIEGHTDARPLRASARFPSNWELSATRAVQVTRFLNESGVPQQRLVAVAMGSTRPLLEGDTAAAYRVNRRVEIHLEF